MVIFTDISGQCIGPIFKGQEVQEEKDYHLTLCNTPEERISHQHCVGKPEITETHYSETSIHRFSGDRKI
jgi:hypothetical protein